MWTTNDLIFPRNSDLWGTTTCWNIIYLSKARQMSLQAGNPSFNIPRYWRDCVRPASSAELCVTDLTLSSSWMYCLSSQQTWAMSRLSSSFRSISGTQPSKNLQTNIPALRREQQHWWGLNVFRSVRAITMCTIIRAEHKTESIFKQMLDSLIEFILHAYVWVFVHFA